MDQYDRASSINARTRLARTYLPEASTGYCPFAQITDRGPPIRCVRAATKPPELTWVSAKGRQEDRVGRPRIGAVGCSTIDQDQGRDLAGCRRRASCLETESRATEYALAAALSELPMSESGQNAKNSA
jgi:hypothetical protein